MLTPEDLNFLEGKSILITGGTGSLGKILVEMLLERSKARRIIIFSRDELKQYEMQERFQAIDSDKRLRYFLGDIRDKDRLMRAFRGVDFVIHAAALKQVPAAEYNPFEFVRTNIMGSQNIIEAAIDRGVKRVAALSTDKAAAPINLYGATKFCADKLFMAGNSYTPGKDTIFATVRYGNVLGSRGSVIPFFQSQREKGVLPITDFRMTRFWITLEQAANFVLNCLRNMQGAELFVPKIPSMKITDLAKAVAPECELNEIGIRPGEKLHEVMIPEELARNSIELDDFYIILPSIAELGHWYTWEGKPLPEGFAYTSDINDRWLSVEDLQKLIAENLPES